jgi:hypothetical protein
MGYISRYGTQNTLYLQQHHNLSLHIVEKNLCQGQHALLLTKMHVTSHNTEPQYGVT